MNIKNQEKIWDSIYEQDKLKWKRESRLPKIMKDKAVLEIGAGNGKTIKAILAQKPNNLTAIDISQEAINILKNKFKYKNFLAKKASALKLPFKDNYFDIVVSYFIFNNLLSKDRKKAISEIYRVLKPSGLVAFADFAEGDYRFIPREVIESNTTLRKNRLIFHIFQLEEVRALFYKFQIKNINILSNNPIRNQPNLKRKRIFMLAQKV